MDEFHTLKNYKSEISNICFELKSIHKIGLTGTLIQNDPVELWSLLNIVAPGILKTKDFFDYHYSLPIKKARKKTATKEEVINGNRKAKELLDILNEYYLRRDKQVELFKSLPKKKDIVVFCKLGLAQKEIYEKVIKSYDYEMLKYYNDPCKCKSGKLGKDCCYNCFSNESIDKLNEISILWKWYHNNDLCNRCPYCISFVCVSQLQKISNHIDLLKPLLSSSPFKQDREKDFLDILDDNIKRRLFSQPIIEKCGKIKILNTLLKRAKSSNSKVLLFSNSTRLLDILQESIIDLGYTNDRIDGKMSSSQRLKVVNRFNNNKDPFIILISTKAGGVGLNLTGGNTVIIFDPNWNPTWDMQAQVFIILIIGSFLSYWSKK